MEIRRLLLTIRVSLLLRPALAQSLAEKQQIPVALSTVNPQGMPNTAQGAGISKLIRQQNGQFGSNLSMAPAAGVGELVTAFARGAMGLRMTGCKTGSDQRR